MHVPAVSIRFGLILEAYCLGSMDHMKSLTHQVEAYDRLRVINEMIKQKKVWILSILLILKSFVIFII